jgi:quercetin dioxygenase-like cupin family protein
MVVPPEPDQVPQPRTHEGYEWLYVLSGRLRLVLGSRDLLLGPGEVVEFDTRAPHWVSNPGPEPAEVLAIFGPQGERMHVRV